MPCQEDDLNKDLNWLKFLELAANSNWYATNFGKCVAIRNGQLLGVYNKKDEAIVQSKSHPGKEPTFVMVVGEENRVVDIPSIMEVLSDKQD